MCCLPNIDMFVDATISHSMFFFTDGFNGYNHINMDPLDTEKTVFWTLMGNFYCIVMPFGLKNAGATYQHPMAVFFHDMLHDWLK